MAGFAPATVEVPAPSVDGRSGNAGAAEVDAVADVAGAEATVSPLEPARSQGLGGEGILYSSGEGIGKLSCGGLSDVPEARGWLVTTGLAGQGTRRSGTSNMVAVVRCGGWWAGRQLEQSKRRKVAVHPSLSPPAGDRCGVAGWWCHSLNA